jgi:ABC-type transport system involved in multi-copper enzyme maturation permease subunit
MMLWYKAWLETRMRFSIALVLCVAFCSELIISLPRVGSGKVDLVGLHGVHSALVFVWTLGVTLLMMGGLLSEKAIGSSSFTLSLPVSRLRLMTVRTLVGLIESVALAAAPWIVMLILAGLNGEPRRYLTQAGFHIFLLLAGGSILLTVALLLSTLIEGQYTAPIASLGIIILIAYTFSGNDFLAYSPISFMTGLRYFNRHSGALAGTVPWLPALAFIAVALCIFAVSVKIIERRDF